MFSQQIPPHHRSQTAVWPNLTNLLQETSIVLSACNTSTPSEKFRGSYSTPHDNWVDPVGATIMVDHLFYLFPLVWTTGWDVLLKLGKHDYPPPLGKGDWSRNEHMILAKPIQFLLWHFLRRLWMPLAATSPAFKKSYSERMKPTYTERTRDVERQTQGHSAVSKLLVVVVSVFSCFTNFLLVRVCSQQIPSLGFFSSATVRWHYGTNRCVASSFSHFILSSRPLSSDAVFLPLFGSHLWIGPSDR